MGGAKKIGAQVPDALPPGVKPKTPYVVEAPPILPTP